MYVYLRVLTPLTVLIICRCIYSSRRCRKFGQRWSACARCPTSSHSARTTAGGCSLPSGPTASPSRSNGRPSRTRRWVRVNPYVPARAPSLTAGCRHGPGDTVAGDGCGRKHARPRRDGGCARLRPDAHEVPWRARRWRDHHRRYAPAHSIWLFFCRLKLTLRSRMPAPLHHFLRLPRRLGRRRRRACLLHPRDGRRLRARSTTVPSAYLSRHIFILLVCRTCWSSWLVVESAESRSRR
jgi:hypothetical protein